MINFDTIDGLRFEQSIRINGKVLFRSPEVPDYNLEEKSVSYLFYEDWNKQKHLLPKPDYKVTLYVKFRAVKRPDGWVKSRVIAYKNGSLLKLETNEKDVIKSVEELDNSKSRARRKKNSKADRSIRKGK